MTPQHIQMQRLALRLMAEFGLAACQWKFRWNHRKRQYGRCVYPFHGRPGYIELSSHFVRLGKLEDIEDTIRHEIAHALAYLEGGESAGHGPLWVKMCRLTGAKPNRCGDKGGMPKGKWRATCPGCQTEYDRFKRPKAVAGYHCKTCGPVRGAIVWRRV